MPEVTPLKALENILNITNKHPAIRVVLKNFRHDSKSLYNIRRF